MIGWLWQGYDLAYRWLHRLGDLPTEKGTILRVGVERHRGPSVRLRDGTVVAPGDLIGTIHFHNEAVAALHDGKVNQIRSGILILRAFERSLHALARQLDDHPRYEGVKAFTAITILHQSVGGFGFEVHPLPRRWRSRIVAAYERFVLTRFHPLGREREQQKRFDARTIWISSPELRRRYGLTQPGVGGQGPGATS
jgi:hypothetical protein